MKTRIIPAIAATVAILTGCSASQSSTDKILTAETPASVPIATETLSTAAVSSDTETTTAISPETTPAKTTISPAESSAAESAVITVTTVTTVPISAQSASSATTAFQANHSISFTPQDLDTIHLKDDFTVKTPNPDSNGYSDKRDRYLLSLMEQSRDIPVYVGDLTVDPENNCIYVIGLYNWYHMDINYWNDVGVFRIDGNSGEITQCGHENFMKLGKKAGFELMYLRGKIFLISYDGIFLVDEQNQQFIPLEPGYNPQICSLYQNSSRLVVQKPLWNEQDGYHDTVYTEFDFDTNTMHEITPTKEDWSELGYHSNYQPDYYRVQSEYAFPDIWCSRTKITVEW